MSWPLTCLCLCIGNAWDVHPKHTENAVALPRAKHSSGILQDLYDPTPGSYNSPFDCCFQDVQAQANVPTVLWVSVVNSVTNIHPGASHVCHSSKLITSKFSSICQVLQPKRWLDASVVPSRMQQKCLETNVMSRGPFRVPFSFYDRQHCCFSDTPQSP